MAEPEKIAIETEWLVRLESVLRSCSEDLRASLEVEYPKKMRDEYPTYARRYENDIQTSLDAGLYADGIRALMPAKFDDK